MNRNIISVLLIGSAMSACSGPVQTRVETYMAAPLASNQSYRFAAKVEQDNDSYKTARKLVGQALDSKGLQLADNGPLLIQISLAERPADISITAGKNDTKRPIALEKQKKFLQSCKDVEHRFSVHVSDQAKGAILYSGKAAEYHCKGKLVDSLPHLVKAAMANFGDDPMTAPLVEVKQRSGLE